MMCLPPWVSGARNSNKPPHRRGLLDERRDQRMPRSPVRGRIIRFSDWVTEAIVAYCGHGAPLSGPVGLAPRGDATRARSLSDAPFIREPVDVVLFATGYRPNLAYLQKLGAGRGRDTASQARSLADTSRTVLPRSGVPAVVL